MHRDTFDYNAIMVYLAVLTPYTLCLTWYSPYQAGSCPIYCQFGCKKSNLECHLKFQAQLSQENYTQTVHKLDRTLKQTKYDFKIT